LAKSTGNQQRSKADPTPFFLNPGRYVGVVIEEDGKTEEEFIEEMIALNDELNKLNREAKDLESVINQNIRQIAGD